MKLSKSVQSKVDEAYDHVMLYIEDYRDDLEEMCQYCECYCGKEHDYTECKDRPCFVGFLCEAYLDWADSY